MPRPLPDIPVPIIAMPDTDDKTITVTVAASGKTVRLPRGDVEVFPGTVYLPAWLYRQLAPYLAPANPTEERGYGKNTRTAPGKGKAQPAQPPAPF
jgi:hypothetical protein